MTTMQTMRILPAAALMSLLLASGCVRAGFELGSGSGPRDSASGQHDSGSDDRSLFDHLLPSDLPPPDLPPPSKLSCLPPTLIANSDLTLLAEPAVFPDGLTLVARSMSTGKIYEAHRSAVTAPFGAWSQSTLFPAGATDPTLFTLNGKTAALVVVRVTSAAPRSLLLCATLPSATCSAVTIKDQTTGAIISHDMDGPSVVPLATGFMLALNIQPGAIPTTDIYLGRPATFGDLSTWTVAAASTVNQPGRKDDDPALSADGTMLLFAAPDAAGVFQLMVAYRASPGLTFSAPELLGIPGGGPALLPRANNGQEIFFPRGGELYHTTCTR